MWDDAQSLRQLANSLFGISLMLVLFGVVHYLVHLPQFALKTVQLGAPPQRVDVAQVEKVVHSELRGNFFTINLENTRQAFEKLPWVRRVNVRREFPWKLEVDLEEQVALARWNGSELVNTHGEVFAAECADKPAGAATAKALPAAYQPPPCGEPGQALPEFIGQPDTAAEVTRMYEASSSLLAPLRQRIVQISLSPRRAWQLHLDDGMVLELGREQAQERLARFVAVYPYSLAPMQHGVSHVDLRYSNGFAAYIPGGLARARQG